MSSRRSSSLEWDRKHRSQGSAAGDLSLAWICKHCEADNIEDTDARCVVCEVPRPGRLSDPMGVRATSHSQPGTWLQLAAALGAAVMLLSVLALFQLGGDETAGGVDGSPTVPIGPSRFVISSPPEFSSAKVWSTSYITWEAPAKDSVRLGITGNPLFAVHWQRCATPPVDALSCGGWEDFGWGSNDSTHAEVNWTEPGVFRMQMAWFPPSDGPFAPLDRGLPSDWVYFTVAPQ